MTTRQRNIKLSQMVKELTQLERLCSEQEANKELFTTLIERAEKEILNFLRNEFAND